MTDAELADLAAWTGGRADLLWASRLVAELRAARAELAAYREQDAADRAEERRAMLSIHDDLRADLAACREALAECRRAALAEAAGLARREAEAYRRNAALCDRTGNTHGGTVDTACSLACERVAGVIGAQLTTPRTAAGSPPSPGASGAC